MRRLLTDAVAHVAHPAIRNRGTIGGSLAHADPASELPACMLALERDHHRSRARRRAADCRERILHRDLRDRAFAAGIAGRRRAAGRAERTPAHFFHEFARRHGDYAIVGLAAQAIVEGGQLRRSPPWLSLPSAIGPLLGRSCRQTGQCRHHAGGVVRGVCGAGRRARSAGGPAGDRRHAPASGEGAAGALRVRAAFSPRSLRGSNGVTAAVSDFARGQWRARRCACAAAAQSGGFPARASEADRHACRLRARGLRRLHGARQWRYRPFLPDACGAGAQRVGRDDRRVVRQRRDCRSAGGVPRPQRPAMRLLHAGHADGGAGSAEADRRARIASRFASIFPAIIAAAPAIRRSSMPSRRRRVRAQGRSA